MLARLSKELGMHLDPNDLSTAEGALAPILGIVDSSLRNTANVAVQPWWRDYAAAAMSGVRAGGSHAPVVNRRVIASRVSRPHLVAVDR